MAAGKRPEIRMSKFEVRNKFELPKREITKTTPVSVILIHSSFDIVSSFELRISNFGGQTAAGSGDRDWRVPQNGAAGMRAT
jgi:hypothetical protein